MSEIDWSKAPEGATHCTPAVGTNSSPVFWRVTGGVARECWAMAMDFSSVRDHFTYGPDGCMGYFHECAIERPAPWAGEGLPPVGADVECTFAVEMHEIWHRGTVIFNGIQPEGDAFVVVDTGKFQACYRHDGTCLRPYRTPEQIAAEERENEVNRMVATTSMLDKTWARKACESLYDAGYRKVSP